MDNVPKTQVTLFLKPNNQMTTKVPYEKEELLSKLSADQELLVIPCCHEPIHDSETLYIRKSEINGYIIVELGDSDGVRKIALPQR